jgi:hypothetical protein
VRRRAAAVLLLAAAAAVLPARVRAQQPAARPARPAAAPRPAKSWFIRPLAYPTYDGDEGLMVHASVALRKAANRLPPANSKSISLDTKLAASGTRGAALTFDAPGWWPDWRLMIMAGTERLQRAPFYGAGSN